MCTSMLGRGLAARGVDVVVVVPLGVGQDAVEKLDGMTVYGYPVWRYPFTGGAVPGCVL
jgi:hypothetical protein